VSTQLSSFVVAMITVMAFLILVLSDILASGYLKLIPKIAMEAALRSVVAISLTCLGRTVVFGA
jgi:hypothetical protein